MARGAVVGALRVDLSLNSAQFSQGLHKASAGLAQFGKMAGKALAGVAVAAAGAATALGIAVRHSINHADELSKTAQKVGMTTEALSRLEWAAKLSDVSLEQLSGGLRKLSQNMAEVAQGRGQQAATAFKALGISVTDAAGQIKNSDAVLAEVADRFSRLEDGTQKTALAMAVFGRSGADLIPLLNSGADGLAAMAQESDRLGLTIGTRTGKAAEQFNDTLTRIGAIMQGVVNQIMEAALPSLQALADTMASPQFADAAMAMGNAIISALAAITDAIVVVIDGLKTIDSWLSKRSPAGSLVDDMMPGEKLNFADRIAASSNFMPRVDSLYDGFNFGTDGKMQVVSPPAVKSLVDLGDAAGSAKTAVVDLMDGVSKAQPVVDTFATSIGNTLADAFSGFADSVLSGVEPLQALGDQLANLGKLLLNSAINNFFGGLFGGGFGKPSFVGTGIGAYGLYANGGITDRPAIFGEAGPEAAVPLPDGRTIPVTFTNGGNRAASEVMIRLDQGLIGQVLRQADENAVQIVRSQAPASVALAQRNKYLGG